MRTDSGRQTYNRNQGRGDEDRPNFNSARSDYGNLAYGGRLNDEGMERGWWDRASDEVSSWMGDEGADRRRRMDDRRGDRDYDRNFYGNERDNERNFYSGNRGYDRDYFGSGRYNQNMSGFRSRSGRDWHHLHVGDIMSRHVSTVHPDDTVQHAARLMGDCDCGAIPVCDRQGRMVGMITDRDITIRLVANGENPMRARVSDCMTDEVFACHTGDSLEHAMHVMSEHQIRRLPILDDQDRVVGIVSQADIAQHACENRGTGERRAMTRMIDAISEPTSSSFS